MENFDNLIISLFDSDAMKGCFKKELSRILDVPVISIGDIWLETELVNNVASQTLNVALIDVFVAKDKLMDLPFKGIYENIIIFEVGDTII